MSQKNGNLPQGWAESTLGELGEWGSGGTPNRGNAEFFGGGIPWLKIGDLNDRIILTSEETITIAGLRSSSAKLLPVGSLLVAMYGSIGKLGITGLPCATNQAIAHCLPHGDVSSANFLAWLLRRYRDDLIALGQGGTQQNISQGILKGFQVVLPPLPEQHRIAAKIEELQARSSRTREVLAAIPPLLEKLRQSVLTAAFRGDLTADWRARNPDVEPASVLLERIRAGRRQQWEAAEVAKMHAKDMEPKNDHWRQRYEEPEPVDTSELPGLPEGWCWASLEELSSAVGTICYGVVQPGSEIDGGVPLLRVCDIEEGQIWTDGLRSISHDVDHQYARSRLQGGEVVVTVVGTIGRVAVVPEALRGANIARAVARIVPLPQVQAAWIGAALQTPRAQDWLTREAREVARKTLNIGTLARTAIPLAPLPEMQLIGSLAPQLLARGHSLEAAARVMSDRLDLQDQSILAKAFRGELVPQDPNDEPASVLLDRSRLQRERDGVRVGRGTRPARPTAS